MLTITPKQKQKKNLGKSQLEFMPQFAAPDLQMCDVIAASSQTHPVSFVRPAISVVGLLAGHEDRIAIACDGVIDIAAALFNVSGRELRSPARSVQSVSRVRQIAMYITHVVLGLSMREVGDGFGRDRTTVLYACHQIEDLREDEEFDDIVARVEQVVTVAFGVGARRG